MEASGTMPACGEKEEGSVFVFVPWRHLKWCQPAIQGSGSHGEYDPVGCGVATVNCKRSSVPWRRLECVSDCEAKKGGAVQGYVWVEWQRSFECGLSGVRHASVG